MLLLLLIMMPIVAMLLPPAGPSWSANSVCRAHTAAHQGVLPGAVQHAHRAAERDHIPQLHWCRAQEHKQEGHIRQDSAAIEGHQYQ